MDHGGPSLGAAAGAANREEALMDRRVVTRLTWIAAASC
jgi:hypothetical protein